jgi:CSLREA domain-containing protein
MVRLAGAVAAVLLFALTDVARASVTVNTTADHPADTCDAPPAGDCTLREAINDPPLDGLILVPAGNYNITSQLDVDNDMTISGAGARTTIIRLSPDVQDRVMLIEGGLDEVSISGVTITGGNSGGQQGGGINNQFDTILNVSDSAIVDNLGDAGGGIWSFGTLNIHRSLIARNHAVGEETDANGGGIMVVNGSAVTTIDNTTVALNTARDTSNVGLGGGIYTAGNLDLNNVTIAENSAGAETFGLGGGLYQNFGGDIRSTVAVNTLVARNAGSNCGGTVNDPIESTNGLSDELAAPSCNTQPPGPPNLLVADTRLGPLANNGGPTDTMGLLADSPGIDGGTASPCPATDQRGVARPQRVRCDIGAYEAEPVQSSQPPPSGEEPLPAPVIGKSVNALPKSGTVKIKLPGTNKFLTLSEGQQIPVGTIVDTRKGRVTLVAAANKSGGTATSDFYDGLFKVTQTKGKKPITVLALIEKLTGCKASGKAAIAKKKVKKRRLWGDGKGRFQTKGKHSAATVVGTKWLVEDRCTSTLTRVARGKVSVRDFVKKKTVIVRKGHKYVARAKR